MHDDLQRRALARVAYTVVLGVAALLPVGCGGDDSADDPDAQAADARPGCADTHRYRLRGTPLREALPVDGHRYTPPGVQQVPVAGDFEVSLCDAFCETAARCGDTFADEGGCATFCDGLVSDGRGANAACYLADCRARERCLVPTPISGLQGCPELCADIERCEALTVLGLTPEPAACEVMCAGRAAAHPGFASALPCLAGRAADCDLDALLTCLPNGASFCPAACLAVDGCPSDSPLRSAFVDSARCLAECEARTPAMAFKALSCVETHSCDATRSCTDIVDPACEAYFDAASTRCSGAGSWPPSPGLLAVTCEAGFVSSTAGLDAVSECLAWTGCEALEAFACVEAPVVQDPPDERCPDICAAFCACGLLDLQECINACNTGTDPSDADDIAACAAEPQCAAMDTCLLTLLTSAEE